MNMDFWLGAFFGALCVSMAAAIAISHYRYQARRWRNSSANWKEAHRVQGMAKDEWRTAYSSLKRGQG